MNIKRIVASATTVGLIGLGGVVLAAGPAAADDHGPLIPGNIYLFNAQVNLDSAVPSNVITSGGGNQLNQWKGLALDTPASQVPVGTTNIQEYVRIPNGNTDPNLWDEIAASPYSVAKDKEGRFYSYADNQGFFIGTVQIYLNTHNHTGDLKLIVVAQDDNANSLGYWSTDVTVSTSANPDPMGTDITWHLDNPPTSVPGGGGGGGQAQTTTTALTAAAAGANLQLTGTVAPASAAGTVTFTEGAATVGTGTVSGGTAQATVATPSIGVHNYTASFTPSDTTAFQPSSSTPLQVTVGSVDGSGNITVTLGVPAAPSGALTLTVPSGASVALTGSRDSGNTRVTATGALPQMTVTDTRSDALLTGWQVNVQASDFSGSAGTIAAKYLGWTPGLPTITPDAGSPLQVQAGSGVASFLDSSASQGLGVSQTLAHSTANGRGSTSLVGQLNLAVPGSALQGSYSSTLTVTLVGG